MRRLIYLFPLYVILASGCAGPIYEVVTSDPYGAWIYWGKTPYDLKPAKIETPYSRKISAAAWESWCYRLSKEGYHDTRVLCRPEEPYRYISFRLEPLKTKITSDPPGAKIYWGPSLDEMVETMYRTPREEASAILGASWKAWHFQAKKEGYRDSEVVFLPQSNEDRQIHFILIPQK